MTQVKRYRRGKVIPPKEVQKAKANLYGFGQGMPRWKYPEDMKADVYVPPKEHFVEWAVVWLVVLFIIVLVGWFSYQKGTQDQSLSDANKISDTSFAKGLEDGKIQGRKEGELNGKVIQRAKDLIACQKHSNIKRSENHCVGEID